MRSCRRFFQEFLLVLKCNTMQPVFYAKDKIKHFSLEMVKKNQEIG